MIIESTQSNSVAVKQRGGAALMRSLVIGAVVGVAAMSTAQAAGQSRDSMREATQRRIDDNGVRTFQQDAHAENMARLRAEKSAENKRKNAEAKAAAEQAAAAKLAAAQAAATPAVPATPATPAVPATPAQQ
jgi:hypothetical protein